MLCLEVCHPMHVLALLMYTASPVYRCTLLQHPVLQTVGSMYPFLKAIILIYVSGFDLYLCNFLAYVSLQTKQTCEDIIYQCQEHKTIVQSSGGSRKFQWDCGLHDALHSPTISSRVSQNYSKVPPENSIGINLNFPFHQVPPRQMLGLINKHLVRHMGACACERQKRSLEFNMQTLTSCRYWTTVQVEQAHFQVTRQAS